MEETPSELQDRVAELDRKKRSFDKFVMTSKKRNAERQAAPNSFVGSERFHGLDFLRAMAMLLGLVFHAPMLYYIPVMADGFKGFTYFMIFFACFLAFMLLLVVLMEVRPDEEAKERRNWCAEYHPNLTYDQCSVEAGW